MACHLLHPLVSVPAAAAAMSNCSGPADRAEGEGNTGVRWSVLSVDDGHRWDTLKDMQSVICRMYRRLDPIALGPVAIELDARGGMHSADRWTIAAAAKWGNRVGHEAKGMTR